MDIDVFIRITTTILGLAYPILLQVIARLDEKYASSHIVELFDNEGVKIWFKRILIISLLSIFIGFLNIEPFFQLDGFNYIINNSADIIIVLCSVTLVVLFFFYVNKILIYYTPVKFINYLIKKHRKQSENLIYFNALGDVFLLSIQKQNNNLSQTISRFYYDEFKREREKSILNPIEYPEAYYSLVYRSIEELAIIKSKKNYALEYRTSGGVWLLGELSGHVISETTYFWLWKNILLAVKYEQDDMILNHWEKSHQYFEFNLQPIQPEYIQGSLKINNTQEILKRDIERDRFLEFHYALGGLLLYKKRYECINRIFNYTTSQPPSYKLLPKSMTEVFTRFVEFGDPYDHKFSWISSKYPFPEQNGINSDNVIKKWILKYIAILFLRQYQVRSIYGIKPLDLPHIPHLQSDKNLWLNSLDFFKKLVNEVLDDDLLKIIGYNFITYEWCDKKGILYPSKYLENVNDVLKKEYEKKAINQDISLEKEEKFIESSNRIISSTINRYSTISNENEISENFRNWFLQGETTIYSKDAFSDSPEAHYIDYDSFLADYNSEKIRDGIASTFSFNKSKIYLLKPEEIFLGIEKLNLNKDYIIVIFGINVRYYIDYHKIKGLSENDFKGIDIVSFPVSRLVDESLFILRKSDLPKLIFNNIDPKLKEKYQLKEINKSLNLFGSVLDMNKLSNEMVLEHSKGKDEEELKKSVLLNIHYSWEIRWKNPVQLIQIMQYSEYRQKGLPNSLDDVLKTDYE